MRALNAVVFIATWYEKDYSRMNHSGVNNDSQVSSVKSFAEEIQARIHALPELKTQDLRAVRRDFSKRLAKADQDFVMKLAMNLLKLSAFEFRFIAYELLQHHRPTVSSLDAGTLEKLGDGMNSWAVVDCFACYLAGPAWRERQIEDSAVRRWLQQCR